MGFNNGYDAGWQDAINAVRHGKVAGMGPLPGYTPSAASTIHGGTSSHGSTSAEPAFTKVTEQGREDDAGWVNKVGRDGRVSIVGTNLTAELVAKFTADGTPLPFNVAEVTGTLIKGQIVGGLDYPCDLVFELEKSDGTEVASTSVEVLDEYYSA